MTARHVTYRMFDRLLARLGAASEWQDDHVQQPRDAEPGALHGLTSAAIRYPLDANVEVADRAKNR